MRRGNFTDTISPCAGAETFAPWKQKRQQAVALQSREIFFVSFVSLCLKFIAFAIPKRLNFQHKDTKSTKKTLLEYANSRAVGLILLSSAFALAGSASAQPVVRLNSIFPEGGQRGTTVEISARGDELAGATSVIFSGDGGLKATIIPREQRPVNLIFSGHGIAPVENSEKAAKIKIEIAADAPLGMREFRIAAPSGVSNAKPFFVEAYPEVAEKAPHSSLDTAMEIKLPAIVNGRIGAELETDFFRFHAAAGERLIFDVFAARMGSKLDSSLAVLDASGEILKENEDANGTDSLIDFESPAEGDYILRLKDVQSRGGGEYTYRLKAGAVPYLDSMFPLGGRRGEQTQISFDGRNLGPMGSAKLAIAADAPLGAQEIRAEAPGGLSNPRRFVVGDFPEITETEPNDEIAKANVVGFPVTINGQMQAEHDRDYYKLKVDNRMYLVLETAASRLGSSLDAVVKILDAKGNKLAKSDDAAGADPTLVYEFQAPGEYIVEVADLLDRGGKGFGYRLTIRPPKADFDLKFNPDIPRVSRGGKTAVKVELNRKEGYPEAVQVCAEGLPEGLTSEPSLIPANMSEGMLLIEASEKAAPGFFPLKISGCGAVGGTRVTHAGQPSLEKGSTHREAFITVLNSSPFLIDLVTLTSSVMQNSSAQVQVTARRRDGYTGDITFYTDNVQRNVDFPAITLKGNETRGVMTIAASIFAETGYRQVAVKAKAEVNGVLNTETAGLLPLTIEEAPFVLLATVPRLSLTAQAEGKETPAGEALLKVQVIRRGWFSDDVDVSLEGLPEGIKAASGKLGKNESETPLTLRASDKAPLDKPFPIRIVAVTKANDREFRQVSGDISVSVSPPAQAVAEKPATEKPATEKPAETKPATAASK